MSPEEFEALCITPACTLREALQRMDQAARGVLLVRDAGTGVLRRTLTDGDLRRARLAGSPDDAAVATASPGLSSKA